MSQDAIEITAKLYQCRRLQIALNGREKFKAKVEEYRPLFTQVMKQLNCNAVAAAYEICKKLEEGGYEGMPQMIILAVCAEILEPSL